jgi:DNA-binding transcriptional LysR family regulator
MEIRNLTTFLEVAERLSFSGAADALGYTQSTVSAQIKALEDELGEPLFERIGRHISLTDRGRSLLSPAREIVSLAFGIGEGLGRERSEVSGYVRIAMADSLANLMLGERYAAFHRRFPAVRTLILPGETKELIDKLRRGEVDLAFVIDRPIYREELVAADERSVEMRFVARRGSPYDLGRTLSPEELVEMPLLLTEAGISYRALLEEKLAARHLALSPFIETGSTERLLELVKLGLGVSFLPSYVTEEAERRGEIVALDIPDLAVTVRCQLLYHRQRWLSPAIQSVIDYFRAVSASQ